MKVMVGLGPLSKKLAEVIPNAERAENRRTCVERMAKGEAGRGWREPSQFSRVRQEYDRFKFSYILNIQASRH